MSFETKAAKPRLRRRELGNGELIENHDRWRKLLPNVFDERAFLGPEKNQNLHLIVSDQKIGQSWQIAPAASDGWDDPRRETARPTARRRRPWLC